MGQFLLLLVVALTVAAVVFGVTVLVTGGDPGMVPAEPDGRAVPLPGARPLQETDVASVRFDTAARGYRMAQVDQAMRRAAYDIGYKDELIGVLEAEVGALRAGRVAEADELRRAREAALVPAAAPAAEAAPAADGPAVSEVTVRAADAEPALASSRQATSSVAIATPAATAAPDPDAVPPAGGTAGDAAPAGSSGDGSAGATRPGGSTPTSGTGPGSERG